MARKKVIKISEKDAVARLKQYIDDCDGDEFARLLGEIFGGECFQSKGNAMGDGTYDFVPNKFYTGEFDQ